MILYHLDHEGTLTEGQIISPGPVSDRYPDIRLSPFGEKISSGPKGGSVPMTVDEFFAQVNTFNLENEAEIIRRESFSDYPSRLSVFYCVRQLCDLVPWDHFFPLSPASRICEIEYDGPLYEFDARFLRGNTLGDPFGTPDPVKTLEDLSLARNELMRYWSRQKSEAPLPEILVPLPVTISRIASLDSYPDFRLFHPAAGQAP